MLNLHVHQSLTAVSPVGRDRKSYYPVFGRVNVKTGLPKLLPEWAGSTGWHVRRVKERKRQGTRARGIVLFSSILVKPVCIEESQIRNKWRRFLWPKQSKIDAHIPNARVPSAKARNTVVKPARTPLRAAVEMIVAPVRTRSARVRWRLSHHHFRSDLWTETSHQGSASGTIVIESD